MRRSAAGGSDDQPERFQRLQRAGNGRNDRVQHIVVVIGHRVARVPIMKDHTLSAPTIALTPMLGGVDTVGS
jgi:hypothetical protein